MIDCVQTIERQTKACATRLDRVNADVAVLEPKVVTTIKERFWVPAYQRGYRWGAVEVRRLLDDIRDAGAEDYYLQPVVVKSRDDGSWELIDGQQRLTTLYLILKHIGDKYLPATAPGFRLEYETREGSAAYLDALGPEPSDSNIDYFHIHRAFDEVGAWFADQPDATAAAINLYQALSERVRVIWYQAPAAVDSTTLFTRLNLGRIPLTDAELIKALVLSRVRATRPDRLMEVAAQWDAVERDLRAPEAWAFVSGTGTPQSSHIDVILDALAGVRRDRTTPAYLTFETLRKAIEVDPIEFWNEVLGVHARILGWYNDLDLYHRIGYLITRGWTLGQVLELGRGRTRTDLKERLRAAITQDVNLPPDELRGLSYSSAAVNRVLLLMNLETAGRAGIRYSFDAHSSGAWSLEHIHAQNAELLTTEAQWREWIDLAVRALGAIAGPGAAEAAQQIKDDTPPRDVPLRRATFEAIETKVLDAFHACGQEALEDVNGIDNLALLTGAVNTALGNSTFAVKRKEILARDRAGEYIPICTRNIFLKYYTPIGEQQLHVWSSVDREHYLAEIEMVLAPYLCDGGAGDE